MVYLTVLCGEKYAELAVANGVTVNPVERTTLLA
jgi:hypothetical protein